jgi:hypothetical protein
MIWADFGPSMFAYSSRPLPRLSDPSRSSIEPSSFFASKLDIAFFLRKTLHRP